MKDVRAHGPETAATHVLMSSEMNKKTGRRET
jgi:hypothetical protein